MTALETAGLTRAEQGGRLTGLIRRLLDTVGTFAALPSAEPGRADAAFCLFLHVLANRSLRTAPAWWPAVIARRLGITRPQEDTR